MKTVLSFLTAAAIFAATTAQAAQVALLNVSYDPTRELYQDLGNAFAKQWKADQVTVNTSNGGSGAQALVVLEHLPGHGQQRAQSLMALHAERCQQLNGGFDDD